MKLCNLPCHSGTTPKTDTQRALLAADGAVVRDGGKRWKIHTGDFRGIFSCVAEDLDPRNDEERQYPIMDLWRSETERADRILNKAVSMGRVLIGTDWEDAAKQYQPV